ncbi:MAG: hypothetical protein DRO43_05285, partial [Candidatus Hecatellales archaeon]
TGEEVRAGGPVSISRRQVLDRRNPELGNGDEPTENLPALAGKVSIGGLLFSYKNLEARIKIINGVPDYSIMVYVWWEWKSLRREC